MFSYSTVRFFLFFFVFTCGMWTVRAQVKPHQKMIYGYVLDKHSNEPLPGVTILISNKADATEVEALSADTLGYFQYNLAFSNQDYTLTFRCLGYQSLDIIIQPRDSASIDLGSILLAPGQNQLDEIIVRHTPARPQDAFGKTIYAIHEKVQQTSFTGLDVLRQLPGVSVDLAQQIRVEGSSKVLILVDGQERDVSFLQQLPVSLIRQVEIIHQPSGKFEGIIDKVIAVKLKENPESGWSASTVLDVPTGRTVYAFPNARIAFGTGKLDTYISYNGAFTYFDIQEEIRRTFLPHDIPYVSHLFRDVRQKNWSHRIHYELDYRPTANSKLGLYMQLNPFSQELDGNIRIIEKNNTETQWDKNKEDTDRNQALFLALFYRLAFGKAKKQEVILEVNRYDLHAHSQTLFTDLTDGTIQESVARPQQTTYTVKLDYQLPVTETFQLHSGIQYRSSTFLDRQQRYFRYHQKIPSLYGGLRYTLGKLTGDLSLRLEHANIGDTQNPFRRTSLLPHVMVRYVATNNSSVTFGYKSSLNYPSLYQLNPIRVMEDRYASRMGNPDLVPSCSDLFTLTYTQTYGNTFLSGQAFHQQIKDVINELTIVDEAYHVFVQPQNLGAMYQSGLQLNATITLSKALQLQPSIRAFYSKTAANKFAQQGGIVDRRKVSAELGLSAMASLGKGFSSSFQVTYNTPMLEIQRTMWSDVLYFVGVEKTWNRRFKTGVLAAMPLSKSFRYRHYKIQSMRYMENNESAILLRQTPIILKLSYSLTGGTKRTAGTSERNIQEAKPDKGF